MNDIDNSLVRRVPWEYDPDAQEPLVSREWLVTNGFGGYASGTISGVTTRRYHGLLISALPAPLGRVMMLCHLSEQIRLVDGRHVRLSGEESAGDALQLHGAKNLVEFRLEAGMPIWRYQVDGLTLEKQVLMIHEQNTVMVTYRVIKGDEVYRLKLRPSLHFRPHDAPVSTPLPKSFTIVGAEGLFDISAGLDLPRLGLTISALRPAFTYEERRLPEMLYRIEQSRGYESRGDLWSPGYFRGDLSKGNPITLIGTTESWETALALTPEEALFAERVRRERLLESADPAARSGLAAELVLAADQFIIEPTGRVEDATRARAAGDEVRTIIAGYHWFADWGRDTMISLEGLTLTTGRHQDARFILRTFADYVRHGLIPNLFIDRETTGHYHTADATMWFFHAISRYLAVTDDRVTLRLLLPQLLDIVDWHRRGTDYGIRVDPEDGLLREGQEGYQLTWMDAKVGDWVVTPRRGKPVEINALWYNALRLLETWLVEEEWPDETVQQIRDMGSQAYNSFNERFWYEEGGYLYDVVDGENGDDPACRPNQVIAISLEHPVLTPWRWGPVLDVVTTELLTPVGLRSLAPGHPDYKQSYSGDLRSRDAAYHQGTVWAWLIGPYIDAWLKVNDNDKQAARLLLQGFDDHLREACVGTISEVFDAEPPFRPRGCVAQAWSVAEVLRCLIKTTTVSDAD